MPKAKLIHGKRKTARNLKIKTIIPDNIEIKKSYLNFKFDKKNTHYISL